MILLLIVSLLIILLCFTPKEGFYSDTDTYSALSSIQKLKTKTEKIKTSIESISKVDLGTSEIIANLRPILDTNKDTLFKNGVVTYVKDVSDKLSNLQKDSVHIERLLDSLKEYNTVLITYMDNLDSIKDLLNKIPDS
jgi:hypothetical protein